MEGSQMIKEMKGIEKRRNHVLNNRGHILYMFSEYESYVQNAFDYICEALNNGYTIILIEDKSFYSIILKKLKLIGYSEADLGLIKYMANTDYYMIQDQFNADQSLSYFKTFMRDIDNLKIKIWGQVLISDSYLIEIRRYEREFERLVQELDLTVVCSYNALMTPAFFQNELLKIHEYFMVDDRIEKSPFYDKTYRTSMSHQEKLELEKLEQENLILKNKNEKLRTMNACQKERGDFLKLEKANAEKANKAKSVFLSQMSHDLRTPLNTIQGYTQLLSMNEKSAERNMKLNKIYVASEQLLQFIEEILDFTVIDSGEFKIKKESVQLKPFLEDCIESILGINQAQRKIQLESVDENMFIEVDSLRFSQIISNLLNNAIKYNKKGGEITVKCSYRNNNTIKIEVIDTGIGVKEDELTLIFEPFYRSNHSMKHWKGSGLGLAIVAQLTKRMNGNYGVESKEGEGSTFWVSFNCVHEDTFDSGTKNVAIKRRPYFNKGIIKALYIEDNDDSVDVMTKMLSKIGNILLYHESSGEIGLKKAQEIQPDIILLDLSLPDCHGIDVLEELKSNPLTKDKRVVAVSADAMKPSIQQALEAGCFDYITKPIKFEQLEELIYKVSRFREK